VCVCVCVCVCEGGGGGRSSTDLNKHDGDGSDLCDVSVMTSLESLVNCCWNVPLEVLKIFCVRLDLPCVSWQHLCGSSKRTHEHKVFRQRVDCTVWTCEVF
jgi:hypothetical protein